MCTLNVCCSNPITKNIYCIHLGHVINGFFLQRNSQACYKWFIFFMFFIFLKELFIACILNAIKNYDLRHTFLQAIKSYQDYKKEIFLLFRNILSSIFLFLSLLYFFLIFSSKFYILLLFILYSFHFFFLVFFLFPFLFIIFLRSLPNISSIRQHPHQSPVYCNSISQPIPFSPLPFPSSLKINLVVFLIK